MGLEEDARRRLLQRQQADADSKHEQATAAALREHKRTAVQQRLNEFVNFARSRNLPTLRLYANTHNKRFFKYRYEANGWVIRHYTPGSYNSDARPGLVVSVNGDLYAADPEFEPWFRARAIARTDWQFSAHPRRKHALDPIGYESVLVDAVADILSKKIKTNRLR